MADKAEQLRSGDILFVQGEKPSGLYMLDAGTVEILSASDEYDGLDRGIIMSRSKRSASFRARHSSPGFPRTSTGPYSKSVRAVTDVSLVKYSIPRRDPGICRF